MYILRGEKVKAERENVGQNKERGWWEEREKEVEDGEKCRNKTWSFMGKYGGREGGRERAREREREREGGREGWREGERERRTFTQGLKITGESMLGT